MPKPLVVMADAERAIVDYLTDVWPDTDDSGAKVGVTLPGDWTPASSPPFVMVALDAGDVVYPIRDRTTIRLSTWAVNTTKAKWLCQLAQSLVLVHPGDQYVWGTAPLLGVRPADDPDTGHPMATCAVAVSVRPQPVDAV